LLGTALACGPFPDNPKTALETSGSQPTPEFGAIPAAACPFPFQLRQPGGETALADAENVLTFTANDLADQTAT